MLWPGADVKFKGKDIDGGMSYQIIVIHTAMRKALYKPYFCER